MKRGRAITTEDALSALALIVFLALPLGADDYALGEYAKFFAYGLLAASLAFVWGHCGLLCLGQAVFFGIGGYAMSIVTLGKIPGAPTLLSSWLGLILAVAIPALFANLLGRFLFYGQGLRGAFFGIVTLAVAVIAERLATNWPYLGGLNGLMNVPPPNLGLNAGGHEIFEPLELYFTMLGVAALGVLLLAALTRSRYGVALKAIRDNETRVQFLGFDTAAYKTTAFSIGGGIAGLAGALFVTQFGFASPKLIGFGLSAEVLIWVAVGGRAVLIAAFLGAFAVRSVEGILSEALGVYWLLALGVLFILTVLVFPRGLIGEIVHQIDRRRGMDID
ncbi:MAG: branched-chain amino acid ABC transporter permease [Alphaproteobacteria bacterium]|nr:branched-chain amino acid ABC transporter permease [Alphaproteobacteria bacterium]